MAQDTAVAEALRRGVHALIHILGATAVQLQIPAPPIANDPGEELGLRAPEFQWKPLVPVAVRTTGKNAELLVPADALEDVLGVQGGSAIRSAVLAISAVRVRDRSLVPVATESLDGSGRECMYRIILRQHDTEVV